MHKEASKTAILTISSILTSLRYVATKHLVCICMSITILITCYRAFQNANSLKESEVILNSTNKHKSLKTYLCYARIYASNLTKYACIG